MRPRIATALAAALLAGAAAAHEEKPYDAREQWWWDDAWWEEGRIEPPANHRVRVRWASYMNGDVEVPAMIARPDDGRRYPAVLFQHGRRGLDDLVQLQVRRIAARGFVVVAPDVFTARFIPKFPIEHDYAVEGDVDKGLDFLLGLPDVSTRKACLASHTRGGYMTLKVAVKFKRQEKDVACYVSWYPHMQDPNAPEPMQVYRFAPEAERLTIPVLVFVGEHEQYQRRRPIEMATCAPSPTTWRARTPSCAPPASCAGTWRRGRSEPGREPAMSLWEAIGARIAEATGRPFRPESAEHVGGGCINSAVRLRGDGGDWFVKLNDAGRPRHVRGRGRGAGRDRPHRHRARARARLLGRGRGAGLPGASASSSASPSAAATAAASRRRARACSRRCRRCSPATARRPRCSTATSGAATGRPCRTASPSSTTRPSTTATARPTSP